MKPCIVAIENDDEERSKSDEMRYIDWEGVYWRVVIFLYSFLSSKDFDLWANEGKGGGLIFFWKKCHESVTVGAIEIL